MSDDMKDKDRTSGDSRDATVTYTQIASCAVPGGANSEPMRRSLRAKLEAEREQRELERKNSLGYRLRSLFDPATS